jgi:CheY-like chemotaxis protein
MKPTARILVVDDEPIFREITVDALADAGYEASEAATAATAVTALERSAHDVVLLDLNMPKLTGWSVLEYVRIMEVQPSVLVMSGGSELVMPSHLAPHVFGYLLKPFSARQLFQTLSVLLGPKWAAATGQRAEARRTFVAEALVAGRGGRPAKGRLLQVSAHGFRAESAVPLRTGDDVSITFLVPGRSLPLRLSGRVRWRSESLFGAAIQDLPAEEARLLGQLIPS